MKRWHAGTGMVALAAALALAGCAKDGGSDPQVASANGGERSAEPSTSPAMDPHELALKFAQCMRENGIDMEDPQEGAGVQLKLRPGQEETVKRAQEACRKYSPAANGAAADPQMEERAREFAKCMRENGVEDFPDPSGQGIKIDKSLTDDPDFDKARQACQSVMGGRGMVAGPGGGAK
ncbi:hypothetical protein [Rhizomonospora bruguierae]|uniref:hypothetical protein n=1 Tax=Rhizomonospora bruguierae TaxID=1581705 RepID=UPI0020BF7EF6|nr:hypothetical protein [Micromonospora sp. NBRC 107566]